MRTPLLLELSKLLNDSDRTISTAESCTGGNISASITSMSGCSSYYLGTVVSYSNSVKENLLGVPADILKNHGAVSRECVAKMAEGVRRIIGSDYAIATSGIAGPQGGSQEKPVGLVWIGFASKDITKTYYFINNSDRNDNISQFTTTAMRILVNCIKDDLSR